MAAERRLLPVTTEALARILRPGLTPALRERFKKVGMDLDSPGGKLGVTFAEWNAIADLAREVLFPNLPRMEGALELGRRFTRGYFETISGRALLALLRLLGPHRSLERTPDNLRSGNPHSEVDVKKTGPNEYEIFVNYAMPDAEFTMGLMEEGVRLAGAKGVRSRLLERKGESAKLHFIWDD